MDLHEAVVDRLASVTTSAPVLPLGAENGTLARLLLARGLATVVAGALTGWGQPFSFDAETAPALVAEVFEVMDVQYWGAPVLRLPDVAAIAQFLRGRVLAAGNGEATATVPR